MKTNYLLPHSFKKIGWIMFIPSALFGLLWIVLGLDLELMETNVFALFDNSFSSDTEFCTVVKNDILDEILGILIIVGAVFIAFSKEKEEDEFISRIRLDALVWATYLNYAILVFAILFVYNFAFFWVLVFNMFTILVFFLIRFYWLLYKSRKSLGNEK